MNAVVSLVKKFPNTALAGLGILTVALTAQTIRLQLSQLTTLQIIRAAEDLGLDHQLTAHIEAHGPYYK